MTTKWAKNEVLRATLILVQFLVSKNAMCGFEFIRIFSEKCSQNETCNSNELTCGETKLMIMSTSLLARCRRPQPGTARRSCQPAARAAPCSRSPRATEGGGGGGVVGPCRIRRGENGTTS